MNAMTASGGKVDAVTDEQILDAYRFLAAHEGVFCEPASAASVAGLLSHGAPEARRVVCVLTGHGLKDPQTALSQAGAVVPCEPELGRSSGRCSDDARPAPPRARAGILGQPRSRVRRAGGGAGAPPRARGGGDRARSRSSPSSMCRATRDNLLVRAFERLHSAEDFEFRIASAIPMSGGLGSSAAAIVAGLLAADHIFELDAAVRDLAIELEGHPDNVSAALEGGFVICDGDRVTRFDAPMGLEAILVIPDEPVTTSEARAALPDSVPLADAARNVAHVGDAHPGPVGPATGS